MVNVTFWRYSIKIKDHQLLFAADILNRRLRATHGETHERRETETICCISQFTRLSAVHLENIHACIYYYYYYLSGLKQNNILSANANLQYA